MKQYYESEVLFQLMERDGFNIPSSVPPYESEIKAYLINQVKQAYPKLTDYEAEWLLYNYTKHLPAEFPISSVTNATSATFENVVPFAYQSAILKGNTKYRDIDTEDILDTFDETKNLELVSVKLPVLTTVGKNLFDFKNAQWLKAGNFNPSYGNSGNIVIENMSLKLSIPSSCVGAVVDGLKPNTVYYISAKITNTSTMAINNGLSYGVNNTTINGGINRKLTTNSKGELAISIGVYNANTNGGYVLVENIQVEEGSVATPYEPYQSNILTVNEDVTLRSNGDVYDELNLLTGRLTQRIDENNEVLAQAVVKTVDLTTVNEKGETTHFMPLEGTMNVQSSGESIKPTFDMAVPVEATTQNLASFIDLETEE